MDPQITVYTAANCATCQLVKQYLKERGLPYRERDVSGDPAAAAELKRLNAHGVPVTVIGHEAVLGFDKYRLDDLLKAQGVPPGQPT